MNFGRGRFKTEGVKICIEYFESRGFQVEGFVPNWVCNPNPHKRSNGTPDDVAYMRSLRDAGYIGTTPNDNYDDSYAVHLALENDGFIVTNDKLRDQKDRISA